MTEIGQSNLLQALGWAVFNSLWQMAILWVAYQLITSVFRINKSSQKNFLSAFFLFAGFAWFIFTFIAIFSDQFQYRRRLRKPCESKSQCRIE